MNYETVESALDAARFAVVCAWCGTTTGYCEVEHSHGMCQDCYHRVTGVPNLSPEEINELPFGVIELNEQGTVLAYNRAEEQLSRRCADEVIGSNFFVQVAPCTRVQEFEGRFRKFLQSAETMKQFRFTFRFQHGATKVQVVFVRVGDGRALVHTQRTFITVKKISN